MAEEMVCQVESEKIEQFLQIIIIKLALLTAMKIIKYIVKTHKAYKTSMKKKYVAKDITAKIPRNTSPTESHA